MDRDKALELAKKLLAEELKKAKEDEKGVHQRSIIRNRATLRVLRNRGKPKPPQSEPAAKPTINNQSMWDKPGVSDSGHYVRQAAKNPKHKDNLMENAKRAAAYVHEGVQASPKPNLPKSELTAKSEDEPDEEDIFFSNTGRLGAQTSVSYGGKHLGTFNSEEAAHHAAREHSKKTNWRPNAWTVSDHGNHHLIHDFHNDTKKSDGNSPNLSKEEVIMDHKKLLETAKELLKSAQEGKINMEDISKASAAPAPSPASAMPKPPAPKAPPIKAPSAKGSAPKAPAMAKCGAMSKEEIKEDLKEEWKPKFGKKN